jgi:hypothetical protein
VTTVQITGTATPATATPSHRAGRIVRGTLLGAALAVAFVGANPGSASAQESGDSTQGNVAVEGGITLTGLTPSFTLTGTPGETVTGTGVVEFNVETNNVAGYAVTVQSAAPTMLPADQVANTDFIAIGDLTVRETGAGSFTPMTAAGAGSPVLVHTQAVRSANGGDNLSNDYEINVPTVNVDTYSATLDYIATTL